MPGLRWKKLDLHIHTPASECFKGSKEAATKDRESVTPSMIVAEARGKGLDGIAVCDHMSGAWVDDVKSAAAGTPLVVFPGVEISVGKIHIVALFDVTTDRQNIDMFLGSLDVKPDHYGSTQNPVQKHPVEVLKAIKEWGGLPVLAHIDCPYTGAWVKLEGADKKKVFGSRAYAALEVVGDLPDGLSDSAKRKSLGLADTPAFYRASDNPCPDDQTKHCLSGIGSRFAYFNVIDALTLESLRQCFEDPEQRIVLPENFHEPAIPRIRVVKVQGGFLNGESFQFHRGLNSIIGGKGVGKSLVVEFTRMALGIRPTTENIRQDHDGKIAEQLGEGGIVEVECVTKTDERLAVRTTVTRVVRRAGNRPASYEPISVITNADTNEELDLDMSRAFPVKAFSQGEIVEITREKGEQLLQIDRFVDLSSIRARIIDLLEKLESEIAVLVSSRVAYAQIKELEKDVGTASVEVSSLEIQLKNPLFSEHKGHEDANALVESALMGWNALRQPMADAYAAVEKLTAQPVPANALVGELIAGITAEQTAARTHLLEALEELLKRLETGATSRDKELAAWRKKLADVKQRFEDYKRTTGGDYAFIDKRRQVAAKKLKTAEEKLARTKLTAQMWDDAAKRALAICDELDQTLETRHRTRKDKAASLSSLSAGLLRMEVKPGADRRTAVSMLREAGSGLWTDTLSQFAELQPSYRLALLLLGVAKRPPPENWPLADSWAKLSGKVLSLDTLATYLSRLAQATPEDVPQIEFRRHGNDYALLEDLSQGQKCTALILLTLLEGEEPVMIDQPEDSLDVRAVWEEVVQTIRHLKGARQFLFTTHNSSIAVAGDSDCITILEPKGKLAGVTQVGAIEQPKVKDGVITHLEGGRRPYNLRRRKYDIRDE